MASVSAGDVVAEKYRVEGLLGRGGMGYVVAARHLTLDQLVAIKFLRKSTLSDEEALARFRREAKACVRLKNEHVAKVFDVGVHGEEPFIVMEHLEGADLGAIATEGRPIGISEACDYVLQACEALAEAHSLGIVHRDIKLPNLFLCAGPRTPAGLGSIKVLDFGVSKSFSEHEIDVTQTAAVLGSPKYMSPEQMNDPRNVDGRTDIWSLGVCLYRLVSGHAPFDGDTIGRLCTMVLHEIPAPLSSVRPDVPPALEAAVTCAMQKDRAFRFANVAELAAALVPFASSPEHAADRARHVATVLGVTPSPPGYCPPPPAAPLFQTTTGQSLEGPAAWAVAMVEQQKDKRRSELTLALAAGSLLLGLTVVGVAVFVRGRAAPAVAAPSPPAVTIAPVTTPLPTPAPSPVPVPTIVATGVAAQPTATPGTRRPGGGHGRPNRPPPRDDARTGPLPIPGDRK